VGREYGIYLASTSWKRRGGSASAALSGGGAGVGGLARLYGREVRVFAAINRLTPCYILVFIFRSSKLVCEVRTKQPRDRKGKCVRIGF